MNEVEKQLIKRIDAIGERVEAMTKARGPGVADVFNPNGFRTAGRGEGDWQGPIVKQLEKAYGKVGDEQLIAMLKAQNGGKLRGIGMGPALCAIADAAGHSTCHGGAFKSHPGKLEEAFGLPTVMKADSIGIKALNGEVRKTALAEGSGLTGGYIIPPQWIATLNTIAAEDEIIIPRAAKIPMTTREVRWPMLDVTTVQATGTSPYFGGVLGLWGPEASTISESEPQFRESTWTAWDLMLYAVSSNQLLADNGVGLDALLTQLFAKAIVWYKEYAFLRGTGSGSSMPLGIINAPATIAVNRTTASHVIYADLVAMMAKLHVRSWESACWFAHPSVLPDLLKMNDFSSATQTVAQHFAWVSPYGDGKVGPAAMKMPNALLNGLPLFWTEKLPQMGTKGDVLLADLSQYVIGNRLEYQIDVSPHYVFRTNQMAWRVIARCDGKPWLNSWVTDSQGYTSSPFVCLN